MLFQEIYDRFCAQHPLSVSTRLLMQHVFDAKRVDALFRDTSEQQYEKTLLFSTLIDLMLPVIAKTAPSVHAAYQRAKTPIGVSVQSIYNKLNRLEPATAVRLVQHTVTALTPVLAELQADYAPLVPGYRTRILDGNHLGHTDKRLAVLSDCAAAALPGTCLVVLDAERRLAVHVLPCEDAHAQERSLTPEVLACVQPEEVWIADRNFCTVALLLGIAARQGGFVIREHKNLPWRALGPLLARGRCASGELWEQPIRIENRATGAALEARRIVVRLDTPTRDDEEEIALLTNLPSEVSPEVAAGAYRHRWTLEAMFLQLARDLRSELDTLGYPKAALFGFCLGLCAYHLLSTLHAALRATHGQGTTDQNISPYYIALESGYGLTALGSLLSPPEWDQLQPATPQLLATEVHRLVGLVPLRTLKKHPRGPKKPSRAKTAFRHTPHVSTYRLLSDSG